MAGVLPRYQEDQSRILQRRLPVGAEALPGGGVHFRVWAPDCGHVELVFEESASTPAPEAAAHALVPEDDGYFSGFLPEAVPGMRYRYRLDRETAPCPDPASRFQPEGPHGPSEVVDPRRYAWTDQHWLGCPLRGQVIYEMHIGTFTPEGTWRAAARELPELAALGITLIEVMPVAEFPGRFGWGYDGVSLYAPTRLYGTPDDFRHFVDEAHRLGLGVILDVVYNHIGPDGNYLGRYARDYFTDRHTTDWGQALNFDGPGSGPVREFFIANAGYWVSEFHLDGLRLDATQNVYDDTPSHILAAVTAAVRAAAGGRETVVVAENEPQHTNLVRSVAQGGYGMDALWNDDFHHSAMVALNGRNEAYYSDHEGRPQELISAVKWGYLFQGQHYRWQKQRRGTPTFDLAPAHFVNFIQNHDQIANSGRGLRCHATTSPGRYKAMTALLLLAPGTPMLFQGQEFAVSTPFHFFADHTPDLGARIAQGRAEFLAQFRSLATPAMRVCLPDPCSEDTFRRSCLNPAERTGHAPIYDMHRDLLRLRREDAVFRLQALRGVDGAVLADEAFVLRWFAPDGLDRLLCVNLGVDLHLERAPEPLLAPPAGMRWQIRWSSEDPRYGGCGTPPLETEDNWRIPGHAAVALWPVSLDPDSAVRTS